MELTEIQLPVVSVIVVNFNYGRFLRQCALSIIGQTYQNIECIIVDNSSTDISEEILRELESELKTLRIVRMAKNVGQCSAAIEGYRTSRGEYVVFVDADDFLLPEFVATHIFVQLSLRAPVGLTSSDMLQASDSNIVIGTFEGIERGFKKFEKDHGFVMRSFAKACPDIWQPQKEPSIKTEDMLFVSSEKLDDWVWAPTSGNCFRRDALELFMYAAQLPELGCALDTYLVRSVHAITGSILIDQPLSVYRIHGENLYSKKIHMHGTLSFDKKNGNFKESLSRIIIINHILSNIETFSSILDDVKRVGAILVGINDIHPALVGSGGTESYLEELLRGFILKDAGSYSEVLRSVRDYKRATSRRLTRASLDRFLRAFVRSK